MNMNNINNNGKKEGPPAVHVPIEPAGMNLHGTMHFSQGLLPSSCWLVVPVSSLSHPQVPVPQIQVMNSQDYVKIIEIACADLAITTKLKCQKKQQQIMSETANTKDFMQHMKEQFERGRYDRTFAMLNNSGAPSPSLSTSPSMSPRASNEKANLYD
ncbi:hypothetical protein GCK72_006812 [Caenorhabditis remanei]|uniref:Uncharacterized protein n=1 Tax=Caenorhabditis remanei TaxID=31234 RepID=E3M1Z0_CAERE|nr:hypothetical protein GCK72_006812 [Caenorhabditis remanei]EFO88928.1 hypothetical protein CRE_06398 [Caenorhabditis remanei]KAF1766854.1 hypothetical protein GCK72_006812 [Caenorhabditis remanei]